MSSNSAGTSTAEQLVPFTGMYTLDAGSGAFFLIDTYLFCSNTGGVASMAHTGTVTISMDGISSSVYDCASCCTFDKGNLTITYNSDKIAEVFLYRDYCNGNSSALRGTVQGTAVTGVTPFRPIQLPVFAAEYFETPPPPPAVSPTCPPGTIQGRLLIKADYSVWYREGFGEYVQIDQYLYNFGMFVVEFKLNGAGYAFEMGTAAGYGRVAGNSAKAGLLISICSSTTYPPAPKAT